MKDTLSKNRNLGALLLLLVSIAILNSAFAADFSATPDPSTAESGASNVQLNFTINNTDSEFNITEITITIPATFTFIDGSNTTSVSNTNFSNTSVDLTWSNTTAIGILENGTEQYFLLNISVPTGIGNHSFNITTLDTNGTQNTSYVNITVSDTTDPTTIIYSPNQTNYTTTSLYLNFTFTELNNDTCWYDYNSINNTLSGCSNTSFTAIDNQESTLTLWINDSTGNINSSSVTFNVSTPDTTSPTVTITYPADSQNISTSTLDINFTATDLVASTMNCSIYIDGDTSYSYNNASTLNATPDNYTHTGLTIGTHNLTVNCSDANNTGTASADFGVYADLAIQSITWNSTGASAGDNHTTENSNITVTVVVNNTGDFNITESVNLTLSWRGSSNYVANATVAISNESLTAGSSNTTLYYHMINTTYVTFGYWPITATITTDAAEALSSNNALNVYKTVGYNVTLTESHGDTAWINDSYPAQSDPGEQILYNVTITYADGSEVTGLITGNFTVSETSPNSSRTYSTSVTPNGNNYWFNITAPSVVDGTVSRDIHTIVLNATSENYTGIYTAGFNLTTPYPGSSPVNLNDLDLAGASTIYQVVNVTIKNTGSKQLIDVNTTLDVSAGVTKTFTSGGRCDNIPSIAPGESNTTECFNIKLEATATGEKFLYVNVSGRDADSRIYYSYAEYPFLVEDLGNQSDTGGDTGSDTDTTSTPTTSPYNIDITDYTATFTVHPGETIETTIDVKNTGDQVFTAVASVVIVGLESVEVSPSEKLLSVGDITTFTITMKIPEDMAIAKRKGTFKAQRSGDNDVVVEKVFEIIVQPTTTQAGDINATFANYSVIYNDLKTRFDAIKSSGLINETNLTVAQTLVNEILDLINQTEVFINSGDYVSANTLLSQIESKLDSAEQEIKTLELQIGSGLFLFSPLVWALIGAVVVVVAAFMYYNFFMHKGGMTSKGGYKYNQRSPGIMGSLSDRMKLIKGSMGGSKPQKSSSFTKSKPIKPSAYSGKYAKQDASKFSTGKRPGEGFKERLKNFFSKKSKSQKSMGDFSR